MSETLVALPDVVEYPTRDGRPVAETDLHYLRLAGVAYGLRKFLGDRDDVYVGSNLLVFDEPGNPRRHLSPDVFVAFGVASGSRDLYKIWQEKPPAFVLEITSKSTRHEDERTKRRRYAEWGVTEYFLYDPRDEWVKPPLTGLELHDGRYRRMQECLLPNGRRGFQSHTLGLYLWLDDAVLRLYDPMTGRDLPTPEEEGAARDLAEARADVAAERAEDAEERAEDAEERAEVAEERAEVAEQRAQLGIRALLKRQADAKFGTTTAGRLGEVLEPVTDIDVLTEIGDLVLLSGTGAELLARADAVLRQRDRRV